jgi:hypothetical protein
VTIIHIVAAPAVLYYTPVWSLMNGSSGNRLLKLALRIRTDKKQHKAAIAAS